MPKIYVIAGCNGAGKTTASFTVLPGVLDCEEFVNADEIARGLSPFNPESSSIQAGRLMIGRINQLLDERKNFAFETTLASRSFIATLRAAKEMGYEVSLLFFWLESVDLAIRRVNIRVEHGGHDIPQDVIARRYRRGLQNLNELYLEVVDHCMIFDNSAGDSAQVAEMHVGGDWTVFEDREFHKIISTR